VTDHAAEAAEKSRAAPLSKVLRNSPSKGLVIVAPSYAGKSYASSKLDIIDSDDVMDEASEELKISKDDYKGYWQPGASSERRKLGERVHTLYVHKLQDLVQGGRSVFIWLPCRELTADYLYLPAAYSQQVFSAVQQAEAAEPASSINRLYLAVTQLAAVIRHASDLPRLESFDELEQVVRQH